MNLTNTNHLQPRIHQTAQSSTQCLLANAPEAFAMPDNFAAPFTPNDPGFFDAWKLKPSAHSEVARRSSQATVAQETEPMRPRSQREGLRRELKEDGKKAPAPSVSPGVGEREQRMSRSPQWGQKAERTRRSGTAVVQSRMLVRRKVRMARREC
jgi:hypothetical protein